MTAPVKRSFAERYRMMRTRWNEDWWSIAFGGPVANVLTALIADISWITPNALTWLSFLCKLVAAPLLLAGTWSADVAAVVMFQLHTVLDCMDGTLARYRKRPSVMGGFLDKVTDMIGLVAIMSALGWRGYTDSGDARVLLVALLIAASVLFRSYVFWVVAHFEREHRVEKPSVGDRRPDFSTLTLRERTLKYLKSQWKVIQLTEADLYFWLSLGIVFHAIPTSIYLVGIASGIWLVVITGRRYLTIVQLDRARRRTNSY